MPDLLIKNADIVVTMDAARREVAGGDILVRDGAVVAVGQGLQAPGAEVLRAEGCVVTPGLVNTHHHLYQTLTRAVPGGQDALLFGWLRRRYIRSGRGSGRKRCSSRRRSGWPNWRCRAAR
jgi:cytosine/adenosine deaminase-related metal-dependent hydrolase